MANCWVRKGETLNVPSQAFGVEGGAAYRWDTCPREGEIASKYPPGALNPLITAAHQQHEPEGEPDKGDRNPLFAAEAVVADAEHSDEIVPQLIR